MSSKIESQSTFESDSHTATVPTWARMEVTEEKWRQVHIALLGIAQRRAALDAEEAHWLREANVQQIWRPLGMTNVIDYMERVLGYAPRTAKERLRVALALGELPVLTAALEQGALQFSAVRELSRIATPDTEATWAKAAGGKNLREIETLVAGHRPGDLPDDPTDPDVRTHVVRFELSPETFAALRQARSILDAEHHTNLTDDELIATLANTVIDGATPSSASESSSRASSATKGRSAKNSVDDAPTDVSDNPGESASDGASVDASADTAAKGPSKNDDRSSAIGRARYQIAVTLCRGCRQGWQQGGGVMVPIGPAAVARAECDAQHIGALDAEVPQRAYQDISPAVARFVWRRDESRCQTPGCRSSRALEIHHIVAREKGGGHEPSNLRLTCGSCHRAQHDDRLTITGTRDHLEVGRPADLGTDETSKLQSAITRTYAKDALVKLGWKPAIARAATEAALAALGADASLDQIIREALRRCPKPSS